MEGAGIREFTVAFTTQTCDTCNATVHVSKSCECGELTAGPDPHVERRRRLLEPLLTSPAAVDDGDALELAEAAGILDDWIAILFEHLNEVNKESLELSEEFYKRVQLDCAEWVKLGTTKTAMVYGLGEGDHLKNHE